MKPDLEAIRARAEKATAGPWTACCAHNLKGCSHVMHDYGMVAEATKGKWGDDYPSLRFVDGSIDRKVEAYMEQITYGEVSDEQANANKVFIAHAREDIPALLAYIDSLERVREAAKNHSCLMGTAQLAAAPERRPCDHKMCFCSTVLPSPSSPEGKPSREEIRARGYTPPCCDRLGRTHATDCRKVPPSPDSGELCQCQPGESGTCMCPPKS